MSKAAEVAARMAAQRQEEENKKLEEAVQETASEESKPDDGAPSEITSEEATVESVLTALPGGPSLDDITLWRQRFNEMFILPLRDNDLYVWRPIEKSEWDLLQHKLAAIPPAQVEEYMKEEIVKISLIWPRPKVLGKEEKGRSPAGLMNLLYEVIMMGSYFMAPEQAISRSVKL